MKELIVLVATIATLGFISCNHAQKDAEKATQDSIVEAARLDSIAKVQADSIRAAIEAAAADTLEQVIEVAPAVN